MVTARSPNDVASLNGHIEGFMPQEEVQAEDAAGPLRGQWKLYSLHDAYQERPPRRYVVEGLISYPSLSIVYGGPGSLKSMLLADLCMCAAQGKRWLEPVPGKDEMGVTFATSRVACLWIDFDNGRDRSHERFEAAGKAHSLLPDNGNVHYVSMPTPWLDASNGTMIADLAKLIKHLGVRLVVIDNLGLITGDKEENSGEMAQVMGNLRWLCEETESAVIVVHHQRKSGSGDKGIRKGESLRGHSSIEAAIDLALLVERKEASDSVTVIPTKVRGYKEHDAFGAVFTYEHRPGTKDLASARFFAEQSLTAEQAAILKIKNTIKNVLIAHGPLTQKLLVDEVRDTMAAEPNASAPAVNKVRGVAKQMAKAGEIHEFGRGTNLQYQAKNGL